MCAKLYYTAALCSDTKGHKQGPCVWAAYSDRLSCMEGVLLISFTAAATWHATAAEERKKRVSGRGEGIPKGGSGQEEARTDFRGPPQLRPLLKTQRQRWEHWHSGWSNKFVATRLDSSSNFFSYYQWQPRAWGACHLRERVGMGHKHINYRVLRKSSKDW